MYRYLLFDLDGTLTDPKEGITRSVQHSLRHFGIEEEAENLTLFIGPPLSDSYREYYGFDEEQCKEAIRIYRERFGTVGIFENSVLPGIPEMLAELKRRGCKLCLATSKPEHFAVRIIEHYDLAKYFDAAVGSLMNETRVDKAEVIEEALRVLGVKEEEKHLVLMVGDRKHDIIGAQKNGIDSCGVTFGYAPEGELEEYGATHIVESPEELIMMIGECV